MILSTPNTQNGLLDANLIDSKIKKYYDPIHGYIELDQKYWDIIDTEQFQRLRYLKQLGCVNLVFPTATHNRFEHCIGKNIRFIVIGTCYVARRLMNKIAKKQKELDITEQDIYNVSIAGLCHDLGHGPYSHVFDNHFLRTIEYVLDIFNKLSPNITWTHEWASTMLLEYLVDQNKDIDLDTDDVKMICSFIEGRKDGYEDSEKAWMFDIINNKRNSIDVDKFDYIKRDTQMMNLSYGSFDHQILLKDARVIENQIVYPQKHAYEVQKLFQSRYDLYKSIYNHLTVHSVEIILCDVLKAAHNVLYNFMEVIYDPVQYTYLTDNILYEVQVSEDPRLQKAQELIKRLQRRDFYQFVAEIILKPEEYQKCTESDLINYASQDGYGDIIKEDDIAIRKYSVNFAQGDKDPFEFVKFYNPPRYECNLDLNNHIACFLMDRRTVSLITPNIFQEHIIRLFVKDPAKYEIADKAFDRFCKEKFGREPKKGKEFQKRYTQDSQAF